MSIRSKNFDGLYNLRFEDQAVLNGLDEFKSRLGRAYYADVEVFKISTHPTEMPLVFDLYSNLSLVEILVYHEKGLWGYLNPKKEENMESASFQMAVHKLNYQNKATVRVEEFNIFLTDCAIVVKRIYDCSIEQQLMNIFNALAEHYVHLTKDLSKTPYEIFVPVFSEELVGENISSENLNKQPIDRDYFKYWGLYFSDEEDAVIYDLSTKSFISGDLYMLDQ